jgi:D-alanyl-D-alanine carboxypeptidase/D-alanyl-D-alanine-endopeptidase (penicillin-binding protein 4)
MRAFRWLVGLVVIVALGVTSPAGSQEPAPQEDGEEEAPTDPSQAQPVGPKKGATAQERQRWLADAVNAALAARPELGGAQVGISIRDTSTGRELVAVRGGDPFNVASNVKLVTTAAALVLLGPEYRYRTTVYVDRLAWDGRDAVKGDLYVQASGDPSLDDGDLDEIARELARLGIRKIDGALVIDDSFFDGDDLPPAFDQKKEDSAFRAPVSAASLNYNAVALLVQPGAASGDPARVQEVPESDYVELVSTATTVSDGRNQLVVALKPAAGKPPRLTVEISGTIRADAPPTWMKRRIDHPTEWFGEAFRAALAERGIKVKKKTLGRRAVPATARSLVTHSSEPMAVLVRDINKYSNNFMAETVLKTIGAERRGRPGTWTGGTTAVREWLAAIGLADGSYRYDNGSGLYDSNRFSATQLTTLLTAAHADFRIASDYLGSLAIAGADGTLRSRMLASPAARWVRAKTGTLRNVSALAGYAGGGRGGPLSFAVIVNDIPEKVNGAGKAARALQDDVSLAMHLYLAAD